MPAPLPDTVTHAVELLDPLGPVRVRRMFGGYGLYVDDLFISIIVDSTLYLKVDDTTRAQFEAAGGVRFVYTAKGEKSVSVNYMTPPGEALESPAEMVQWARLAMGAALRAANAPAGRKKAVRKSGSSR